MPMPDSPVPDVPSLPPELPIVPVRDTVVLPLTAAPLAVTRPRSVEAVHQALAGNRMLLLLLQTGDTEEASPSDLKKVGTVALIRQLVRAPDGVRILVEGVARARAEFIRAEETILKGLVKALPETVEKNVSVEAHLRRLRELADRALSLATGLSPEIRMQLAQIDDPLRVCYLIASLLDMKAADKQRLLEENDIEVKLTAVAQALAREIEVLELKGKIESEAQQEMTDAQRKYVLRQQLKAIQDELGEGRVGGRRAAAASRGGDAPRGGGQGGREGDRPARPHDVGVARVPDDPHVRGLGFRRAVEHRHRGPAGSVEARRVLDEDHYDLDKVKERIVEYLAVRKLKGDMKGPHPLLRRPARRRQDLARPVDRARDEPQVRAHLARRRARRGRDPRPPAHLHRRHARTRSSRRSSRPGSINPVFMLDEIDKVGGRLPGRPGGGAARGARPGAELDSFRDHYLEIAIDLSQVLFIATANQLGTVHPALARPHGDHRAQPATPRRRRSTSRGATSSRGRSRRTGCPRRQ